MNVRAHALVLVLICCQAASGPLTVEQVLLKYHVARAAAPGNQLNLAIARWTVRDSARTFLFSWYSGINAVAPPTLHLLRYDLRTGTSHSAILTDSPATRASFLGRLSVECLGSSAGLTEQGANVYLETHLTPSASCTIVLTQDLSVKAALSGWILGFVGDRYAVFHESMVHFAPTHPLNVSVYDTVTGRTTRLYPPLGDGLRSEYARALAAHPPPRSWRRINNAPCRPNDFSSDVAPEGRDTSIVSVNDDARAFGFQATFTPDGFGPTAQAAVGTRIVDYVFLLRGGRWQYREYTPAELRSRYKTATLTAYVRSLPAL